MSNGKTLAWYLAYIEALEKRVSPKEREEALREANAVVEK